ncbi:hypothetical protein CO668_30810 [Rhizobium anhuiense]|nr:hypothetical protein CO668_30810 [Rhizobium anhuiense]
MALSFYISQTHNLPSYGWKNELVRYHYTDAAGLLGIIESGTLWATDVRHLNDPSEGTFFVDRILQLMQQEAGGSLVKQQIVEAIRKAIASPRQAQSTFSVSFCADGDLLSQWRGYGSFGKGYAIGFQLSMAAPHPQIAQFFDIIYGARDLTAVAQDLLDIFTTATAEWEDDLVDDWASTIQFLANCFKDSSYREECESRIVATRGKGVPPLPYQEAIRYRARGGDIIPYIPISFDLPTPDLKKSALPIRSIVVGPGVDFERNRSALLDLLNSKGYPGVMILPSTIPFRG